MQQNSHAYAVILAGGGGTRLWPKSREKHPKQFLKLTDHRTMLRVAADRLHQLLPWDRIIVVTNKQYDQEVRAELPEIPELNIIQEPARKETALAMLTGALYAKKKDPQAVVMNAASDHTLTNEKEFIKVMQHALQVSTDNDYLVAIGINPTEPNTGFGYIKAGKKLKNLDKKLDLFKVDSFTEKPDLETAVGYISTGKYYWNANMYVWSAQSIQDAFKKHQPDLYELTKNLENLSDKEFHESLDEIYDKAEKISIDYAISEKANNLVLIPGDFGWNDVGYWKVVYDLGQKNNQKNVVLNDDDQETHTLAINSKQNLVHTNNRLVAMLDVNDMIIIDTDEILLIVPKNKSQDIKKIVQELKDKNKKNYL